MKKIFITGASRGIGKAIAENLLSQDYVVIGTATTEDGTNQLSKKGIIGYQLDLGSLENIESTCKEIYKDHSDIEILINNAGFTRDNLVLRMSEDEWQDVLNVHLNGVFRITKRALKPMLKKKWGRIINISSTSAVLGNKGQANYAAAKAGIEAFSRTLAREVGSRGITVNTVAPGFIQTDMTDALPEEQTEVLASQIPMARLGAVDEIAQAVLFLAGEGASYITAQTIHVNGGMYAP